MKRIIKFVKSVLKKFVKFALKHFSSWKTVRAKNKGSGYTYTGRDMPDYFSQVRQNYHELSNPFHYYQELVEALVRLDRFSIDPLVDLLSTPADNQRLLGLRHDIDADPITALRAARHLARYGVAGSFYLLHTAIYYGEFYNGVFVRNPLLLEWVRGFIVTGCEIGIHNDVLGADLNPGVDGSEAFKTELAWLRSLRANIRGTVGHNSLPIYGAENSEVFVGRKLWSRKELSPKGNTLPLESLSERLLNLQYEGTFARPKTKINLLEVRAFITEKEKASVRSEHWMKKYLLDNPYCDWETDYQFWLIGKNQWVAAGRFDGQTLFEFAIGIDRLIYLLNNLPEGSRSVLNIHPAYIRG